MKQIIKLKDKTKFKKSKNRGRSLLFSNCNSERTWHSSQDSSYFRYSESIYDLVHRQRFANTQELNAQDFHVPHLMLSISPYSAPWLYMLHLNGNTI